MSTNYHATGFLCGGQPENCSMFKSGSCVDDDTTGWVINAHGLPRRPKGSTDSIHGALPTDIENCELYHRAYDARTRTFTQPLKSVRLPLRYEYNVGEDNTRVFVDILSNTLNLCT